MNGSGVIERDDLVADRDPAVRDDVRVQAALVHELLDDPRPRQLLQVQTGLADHDAVALDLADAEPLADQVVQAHAADGELAAGLALRQPGAGDDLGLNEREREARPRSLREEVAVAFEALAGEGLDRLDGTDVVLVGGPRVDGADVHALTSSVSRSAATALAQSSCVAATWRSIGAAAASGSPAATAPRIHAMTAGTMAPPDGLEPPTQALGRPRSVH